MAFIRLVHIWVFTLLDILRPTINQEKTVLKYGPLITTLVVLISALYSISAAAFRIGPFKFFESSEEEKLKTETQNNNPGIQIKDKTEVQKKTDAQNNEKEQNQTDKNKETETNSSNQKQTVLGKDLDKINSKNIQNISAFQIEKQNAVIDILNTAKNYIQKEGKKKAFAEFTKKEGLFTKGEVYIFAVSFDGTILAMTNPASIGLNMAKMNNDTAKYVFDLELQTAKAGGGFVNYRWINPVTQQIECKRSYILPMDGYYIGTGYYYSPAHGGRCE